ncbi:MAG: hypothetical protein KY393_09080 [Actinobacteria bacterium]|nr:hypothetical protein [Actinomycetota bacterium]
MADQVRFETGESSDSIDRLLASARAEQSREKKMLVDAVQGARDALRKAETELQEVRDLITSRDETLSEVLLRVQTIEEWSHRVSTQLDRIPETIGQSLASSQELEDRLVSSNDDLLADIREDQVEVVRALGRTFDNALADVRRQLASARQDYLDQLEVATEQMIEKNNATAELMVEHLVGYLAKRDETMHKAREQMLIDMFRKLGASLGNRSSKKVAKAMGATTPPSPKPPDVPPAPKFKVPGAGRPERQSPFARRRGAPSHLPQQEPAPPPPPAPARQFVDRGYQQEIQLDPGLDDDFMTRDELAREYLKGHPQEHRDDEAPDRASTAGPEPHNDFFAGPQGGPGPQMRSGPDRIGGPPRDA